VDGTINALSTTSLRGALTIYDAINSGSAISGATLTGSKLVSVNTIQIGEAGAAPAGGGAAGTAGDIAWFEGSGASYLYVCASASSWMRVALDPF